MKVGALMTENITSFSSIFVVLLWISVQPIGWLRSPAHSGCDWLWKRVDLLVSQAWQLLQWWQLTAAWGLSQSSEYSLVMVVAAQL